MINASISDAADRFWSKVNRTGSDRECWEWTGALSGDGYGAIKIAGKMWRAHRVACVLAHGNLRAGQVVRHACDNPKCCNPHHLSAGSVADNVRDMCERGRNPVGERNGNSALDDGTVRAIIRSHESHAEIGRRYGITAENVQIIRSGRTWKHIPRMGRGHRYIDGRFGEASVHHKLTHADALAILASHESQSALAKKYLVDQATISNIKRGKYWKAAYAEFHTGA